jgi:glycerate dehydrogenase
MKIVVLDGYTLNPGDLNWDGLEALGEVTVYDRTPVELIVERAQGAEIVLTNKTPLGEEQFSELINLKYIGVLATGYNVVDINAAKARGIIISNIPTYGTQSVAQMVFALILEFCQHVQKHSDAVMSGGWSKSIDWCFWNYPLIELAGKTIGIIGFGRIGQQVADIAQAFGMHVIGYDHFKSDQSNRANFRWAGMDELLSESDFISLHCPLFQETKGLINKATIAKMKKTAFLINTSRGPLIQEDDLAEALNKEIIAGAGLDVLSVEPPKEGNCLIGAKNCFVLPHISWATKEARARLMDIAVDNVENYIKGAPINMVVGS